MGIGVVGRATKAEAVNDVDEEGVVPTPPPPRTQLEAVGGLATTRPFGEDVSGRWIPK